MQLTPLQAARGLKPTTPLCRVYNGADALPPSVQ